MLSETVRLGNTSAAERVVHQEAYSGPAQSFLNEDYPTNIIGVLGNLSFDLQNVSDFRI